MAGSITGSITGVSARSWPSTSVSLAPCLPGAEPRPIEMFGGEMAVITGATSGIGFALVEACLAASTLGRYSAARPGVGRADTE
jgi:hypothetical protein